MAESNIQDCSIHLTVSICLKEISNLSIQDLAIYLKILNKMRKSNLKVLKKVPENRPKNRHENHQRKGDDHLENKTVPDLPRNHQQSPDLSLLPSKRARRFGVKSNQMFAQDLSKSLKPQRPKRNPSSRPVNQNQDPNQGRNLSENLTLIHYQSRHAHQDRGHQKHSSESCPRPIPDQNLNLPSRKSQVLKNDRSVERDDQKVVRKVRQNESKKVRKKAKNKRIMFMNQSHRYGWCHRRKGGELSEFSGQRITYILARKRVQRRQTSKAKKLPRKRQGDRNDKLRLLIPQQSQLRLLRWRHHHQRRQWWWQRN